MQKVSFLDLKSAYFELKQEIDTAVQSVLDSGWYIGGEAVTEFEHKFNEFIGTVGCAGTSNGLDALKICLQALDLKNGDEVIVPSNTFIATWLAVSQLGGKIVPVEPNMKTYNIEADAIEKQITSKTKAIVVVHLYGQVCDMDPILDLAESRGIPIIEDAAQAHGALYKGKKAGSFGLAAAWSFYPGKNLGGLGDAGAITSNDVKFLEVVRKLRNYGSSRKYVHELLGTNARLDPVQAAVLSVKLDHLKMWNDRRKKISEIYFSELENVGDLILPTILNITTPVWHLFVIRTRYRDSLMKHLQNIGIDCHIHYPIPPHLSGAYADHHFKKGQFPLAEEIADTCLSLPMGPHLTANQAMSVCDGIKNFFITH